MSEQLRDFTSWDDFYGEVFRVADELWGAGKRLEAGWIAVATDGTTSGEVLPKLRTTLDDLSRSPKVTEVGLGARCAALVHAIDRMLQRPRP